MMEIMGLTGFGKARKKPMLDAGRFDKTKRSEQVRLLATPPKFADIIQGPTAGPLQPTASPDPVNDSAAAPARPPSAQEDDDDGDVEPPYDDDMPLFPTTHELLLKDHTKVVSALTLDPSGARVLSGSYDYDCKLWDFGGMTANPKPFKTWEPAGSYYVHDLRYSNAGEQFLCISGTSQAKLYDRDGEEKCVYAAIFQ